MDAARHGTQRESAAHSVTGRGSVAADHGAGTPGAGDDPARARRGGPMIVHGDLRWIRHPLLLMLAVASARSSPVEIYFGALIIYEEGTSDQDAEECRQRRTCD